MSIIHTLSQNICDRIAAGEVVERPASVVKELVENSLDAGATLIRVQIEDAGRKLISITDNGCGMDEDDALLCFESHATSKIRNEEDIFAIQSFGFRGEAIPSIASVAKVTVRTRQKESDSGFEVVVHGGTPIVSNPVGCAPGTEISVKDLFYNVPARKKFLKSVATEENHIMNCMTNIALAHPDISFELKLDGRVAFNSPGSPELMNRIRTLFGKTFADVLVPLPQPDSNYPIRVNGYISRRSYLKASRGEQRFFVNGRPVESTAIFRGVRDGYGPILEHGKYPAAFLFVEIDPGLVDVNVHPTKKEVRFRDDFSVIGAVRSAVTTALRNADPVIPRPEEVAPIPDTVPLEPAKNDTAVKVIRSLYPDFKPEDYTDEPQTPQAQADTNAIADLSNVLRLALVNYAPARSTTTYQPGSILDFSPEEEQPEAREKVSQPQQQVGDGFHLNQDFEPNMPLQQPDILTFPRNLDQPFPNARTSQDQLIFKSYKMRLLGIMENSYIIGVIANGLVLIDQHAAHERVLFEKILKGVNGEMSQRLLFPITLEVSRTDKQYVSRYTNEFAKIGFEVEPFGDLTLKLNAIPAALSLNNAGGVFLDMLSRITERGSAQQLPIHDIATAACKAAVKAHDKLTIEECDALIRELAQCELPFSCPHGRPTVLNISLSEIEHRFGRK